MILARVIGTLTSADKDPELRDYKLLVVQPLGLDDEPDGEELIAVDRVDAGIGEKVLVVKEGNAARQITGSSRLSTIGPGLSDDGERIGGRWRTCRIGRERARR